MEHTRTIEFTDGALFTYVSEKKEESGHVGVARACEG